MPVLASGIGAEFQPQVLTVTPRMALAYAACIGCKDERYLDDARKGGLEVPGPFCAALEWKLAGDIDVRTRLGLTPAEAVMAVHAGQSTRFHRPLFAGESVTISGRVLSAVATRAGALVTSEMTVSGAGDDITTTRSDVLYRGVACDAERSESKVRQAPEVDDEFASGEKIFIERMFTHIYSECALIWNPIHTERRKAIDAGLPDIIVHGTALWALAWKHFIETYGPVLSLSARFSALTFPGRAVTLREALGDRTDSVLKFRMDNHTGAAAISAGSVELERR